MMVYNLTNSGITPLPTLIFFRTFFSFFLNFPYNLVLIKTSSLKNLNKSINDWTISWLFYNSH